MDLVSSCKEKLTYFRIKELKDVLTQLCLSKQGKKQDLVDRILAVISDDQVARMPAKKNIVGKEEVAKLVEDTYRKMQVSGAIDLASKGPSVSDTSNVRPKEEIDDPFQSDSKTRCPCGSSLLTDSMIKCDDPRCRVWQHLGCVIIPEKPMEADPPHPEPFYCEICRLIRADPFWVTVAHPLFPVKLSSTIPTDGSNPLQSVEKSFQLTRADKDLLTKQDFDVQAWCMLLNDKVPFRMQWPQYADLQVNGMPIRAVNRPGSQLLGANGRDDGPIITPCTKDGLNKISLSGCDTRIFCLGVRIIKRRSLQQILYLIPKESDGEPFEDALARVRRCVNGGTSNENADSDSDIEVVADSFSVNLRCPMSGSRMKVAGRFKPCLHMGCFDLDVFVEMNQRSRKWQCPICLKNYALENVIIDPYFNRITSKMRHCSEDITDVELKPEGSWRVKTKNEMERRDLGDLGKWHFPDGSLCVPTEVEKPKMDSSYKPVKQEGVSESHPSLKLGIKKNINGFWEVSKPEDMNTLSPGNRFPVKYESLEQKIIPMSSSEDASVNQDGGGNFDFSTTNNGIELDSINVDPTFGFAYENPSAPQGNPEIIELSDSDEDSEPLISSATIFNNNRSDSAGVNFSVPPPGISVSYADDPGIGVNNTCMGLFNANDDEYGMPLWPLGQGTQTGPGFQLFGSEADVSDVLAADMQHNSMSCPTPMNGYTLAPDPSLGSRGLDPSLGSRGLDPSIDRSETDLNDGLVDNPLAFGGQDPSLQIFLPTRPSDVSMQSNLRDQTDVSNSIRTDDWISLRLGGGDACSGHCEPATANILNSRKQLPPREGATSSLAESASLLLGMNDGRSHRIRQGSDSPFSFPRQKRSVRPRLYLSIDSESD